MNKYILATYKNHFFKTLKEIYPFRELNSIYRMVIEDIFKADFYSLHKDNHNVISEEKSQLLKEIVTRLLKNEPVQHILGKAFFYDLEFQVNPSVLIPRQETELLVHILVERGKKITSPVILDIGTGSGCIAIALKKNIHGARVSALDISNQAIIMARNNAIKNQAEVNFYIDDIINPKIAIKQKFNIIVSNPPYVCVSEKAFMHSNVIDFDPELALYVPDDDPLLYYSAISSYAKKYLLSGGLLAFEINEQFGEDTAKLVSSYGFKNAEIIKDLNNKERIVIAVKP